MPHVPEQTQPLGSEDNLPAPWQASWRRGCHCEGAPEEHLEVWEKCRLTGDMEPLWGMLMAHVKEEEHGSNVCVSGPAAGEFSAGNTGLSS